jgi:hypothetical protein
MPWQAETWRTATIGGEMLTVEVMRGTCARTGSVASWRGGVCDEEGALRLGLRLDGEQQV